MQSSGVEGSSLQLAQCSGAADCSLRCCPAAADTTPNILGTFCLDTGSPCDAVHSTCNGNNQLCVGRGPAWPDAFKSTEIIGQRQADKAQVRRTKAGDTVCSVAGQGSTAGRGSSSLACLHIF